MSPRVLQLSPLLCLTQDGLPWSHVEQAERFCAGGARWIQLRMKGASEDVWLATAREVVSICRRHGACCIINDSVPVARASGADGVHLGKLDLDWREARAALGPDRLLGGTVNDATDAARALACDCLDYVGLGPWRFTHNKQNLAPVLGASGIAPLIRQLGRLPAWVIGGIEPADLPAIRRLGAAGVAVSSALCREGRIEENVREFLNAWENESSSAAAAAPSANPSTL